MRWRWLLPALLGVIVAYGGARAWSYALEWRGLDFYQFWVVGQFVSEGGTGNVYSDTARTQIGTLYRDRAAAPGAPERLREATARRGTLETYSTPFLYTVIRAPSSGDYERDYRWFQAVGILAAAIGVAALAVASGYPAAGVLAAIAFLLIGFAPFRSDVRVGNVGRLQLGAIAAFTALQILRDERVRAAGGGAVMALAVLFKPNLAAIPVLLLISWGINRRLRTLAWTAAGAAAGVGLAALASVALFGSPRVWLDWLGGLREMPDSITAARVGNFSAVRWAHERFGVDLGLWPVAALVGITVLALWIGRARRLQPAAGSARQARVDDARVAGAGALVALLSSPLVWVHYFVLAVPIAVVTLRPPSVAASGLPPWARLSLGAVAVALLGGAVPRVALGASTPEAFALASNTGAALLLGAAWVEAALSPRR